MWLVFSCCRSWLCGFGQGAYHPGTQLSALQAFPAPRSSKGKGRKIQVRELLHTHNKRNLRSESSNRIKNHSLTFCLHSPQSHFSLKWLLFTDSCGSFSPFGKHLCCIHGDEQIHFKNSEKGLHYDCHVTNLPFSLYQRYFLISVYILFFSQWHQILYYGCVCFTSLLLMYMSMFIKIHF